MLPDSCVAQNYQMSSTKVVYIIKHGIAVHVKTALMKEVNGRRLTFHFNQTATQQIKTI